MPKFVEADGFYSMPFTFFPKISTAFRYYMPNEPWLQDKKFFALTVMPSEGQPIKWEGKDLTMLTILQRTQVQFTLVDVDENEFLKDGLINDYTTSLNGSQVRIFKPRKIWPNQSYVTLLSPAGFVASDTVIIFQFWYYN